MIDITPSLTIDGWMEPHDLEWLARQAQTHTRIVEVGAWLGRSTMTLANHTAGVVYAVDHWRGSIEHQSRLSQKSPEWLYDQFHNNLEKHINSGKVIPVPVTSVEAAYRFARVLKSPLFDMVFIDGSHEADDIRTDLEVWAPLCRGLFCGHDAGHPPVEQAVHKKFPHVRHEGCMWVVEL
jgi:predicted O-methyltransferase YrrM